MKFTNKRFQLMADYLQQKVPLPTNAYGDIERGEHDHAFVVAGANTRAIVEDFFNATRAAEKNGETLHDWRKRFDEIVSNHGWDYHGSRGWRSKLIYWQNARDAYNAGREAQLTDPEFLKTHPYWMYRHSGAEDYRPEHKKWDKLVLPAGDPWWKVHSPCNGLNCACKKFPISERYLNKVLKRSGPDSAPADTFYEHLDKRTGEIRQVPKGIDPGFDYTPGHSWLRHHTPTFIETWPDRVADKSIELIPFGPVSKPALPAATIVSEADVMPDGLDDEAYVAAFMAEFGAGADGIIFTDAMGEALTINDLLFRDGAGNLKVSKDGVRHKYVKLLARAIREPDEIWGLLEPDFTRPGKYRLKRRYIARWELSESGQPVQGFSAFEFSQRLWTGNTVFTPVKRRGKYKIPARDAYLDKQREGILLYRKEEDDS